MSFFVVDVEADGPCPGLYSMVSFGAVLVEPSLETTFYGKVKPITDQWIPEALNVSGWSREQHESFDYPQQIMKEFAEWVDNNNRSGRPVLITDNPAFDWQFINYYFHRYVGFNPFGFSARRIGDLYCGMVNDAYAKWKHLRKTVHNHHPVNDAKGNAEALLAMKAKGLKIKFT